MKRVIRFSKGFLPAAIISVILAVAGIAGYIAMGGFNLGVDFQAGLIQEVRFAPPAFNMTWSGRGNATVSFDRAGLHIIISGAGVEGRTLSFVLGDYETLEELLQALGEVEGLGVTAVAETGIDPQWLLHSAQGNPQLGVEPYIEPYVVHYQDPGDEPVNIQDIREALSSLGQTVSVQNMGIPQDRHFMIRVNFEEGEAGENRISGGRIIDMLEANFGAGSVAVIRSDEVAERFSKDLTNQAGILLALTLILILIYASIRFKPQYAIGAVIAIVHDALIMVAYVAWTRMEFNTTTIAAILTILGYSINDTIVIFDRIRENRRIYPDDAFVLVLDRSLTETLSRTIITTVTTMLAVLSLYIFTTGSMKDFALTLLVGMISGVYSTVFIASGFVYLWELRKVKKAKKRLAVPAVSKA
ncbi:MAG: protein translocase subunit SecF [Treponema sp.]|jgi:preprotein translocase subunit SecF|nr:protein translocase subunit SecF [Treponema sp.]